MKSNIQRFLRRSRFTGLFWFLIVGLLAFGCGIKSRPTPIVEEPPPKIADLTAEVRSKGAVLHWTLSAASRQSDKIASYQLAILRAQLNWDKRNCLECPPPDSEVIQVIRLSDPKPAVVEDGRFSFTDSEVVRHNAYRYQINVLDGKGHQLSRSNAAVVRVLAPPQPPKNLSTARDGKGILLQWQAPNKDIEGRSLQITPQFEVQRRPLDGKWETVSPVPVEGNSFFDAAVAANAKYIYRVASILDFEGTTIWSEPSETRQIKAPGALPPPPPDTIWVIPAGGNLEVHWTESEGKVKGYHVYRRQEKELIRLTADPVQGPPFVDRAVKAHQIYFYAVSAVSPDPPYEEGLLSKWAEIRNPQFE